jgi:hypothetical protein
MAESIVCYFHELYEMNMLLLNKAQQEQWDRFTKLAECYVIKMQDLPEKLDMEELSHEEKERIKMILIQIMDNGTEISRILKVKLNNLTQKMSSLSQGARFSQFYSVQ